MAGCGSSGGPEATRHDGSHVDLGEHARAWCGAEDAASIAAGQPRALHVVVGAFPPTRSKPRSYLYVSPPTRANPRSSLSVSRRLSALRRSRVLTAGEDEDFPTAYVFDAKTGNEVA